jgi:hypothetical protein
VQGGRDGRNSVPSEVQGDRRSSWWKEELVSGRSSSRGGAHASTCEDLVAAATRGA